MATLEQMEKKRSRQVEEILAVVKILVDEVAELKIGLGRTDEIELKAVVDETIDRTDEILAAINNAAARIGKETERCLHAIGLVANEMINLKAEIAELKPATTPPPSPASRRPKK